VEERHCLLHYTVPASGGEYVVRSRSCDGSGIRGSEADTRSFERRSVAIGVADIAGLLHFDSQPVGEFTQPCQFVLGTPHHLADPEALSDTLDTWRVLTTEHGRGNSMPSCGSHGVKIMEVYRACLVTAWQK